MRGMESQKNITKTGSWKILVNSYFCVFSMQCNQFENCFISPTKNTTKTAHFIMLLGCFTRYLVDFTGYLLDCEINFLTADMPF